MNMRALKEGEKVAKESIFYLTLLGILKMSVGLITGMTVIIADAISTFADILGIFASYFGLRLSRKSSNKKFEYGYYKIETFAALLISMGIIYLGYAIFKESIGIIKSPVEGQFRPFAIIAAVIAIIHSYRLEKKLRIAGEKVNSLSLLANAKDKKMDIIAGFGILVSIMANYKAIPYVEGIVSAAISLVILKEGVMSAKESIFFLLDYWDDPILIKKIRRILHKEKDIIQKIKKLRLRRAGTFIFGEVYIEINPFAGMQDLREEINLLQEKIKELNPYIKDFAIYTHIPDSKNIKIAIPIKESRGLNSDVAPTLKKTKAYLFVRIRNGGIKEHYTKKIKNDQKNPVKFADFLKNEKVNVLINNKINSLIYYNLRRTNQILVYPNFADIKKASQSLKLFLIDT